MSGRKSAYFTPDITEGITIKFGTVYTKGWWTNLILTRIIAI